MQQGSLQHPEGEKVMISESNFDLDQSIGYRKTHPEVVRLSLARFIYIAERESYEKIVLVLGITHVLSRIAMNISLDQFTNCFVLA